MALFNVRLADDLAARFDAVAARFGGRSQALRLVIQRACDYTEAAPEIPRSGGTYRVEIKLRDDDAVRLEAEARARGLRRTDWIVALIQTRLNGAPVPPVDQLNELIDIRRELRSVGRNLNQAVKALHAANMEASGLDLVGEAERITSMRDAITGQVAAIGDALLGDLAYWKSGQE